MNSHLRLKNHLLLAALAAAYPALSNAAPAARIEFAAGNVMAITSSGQRQLSRGSEVNSGDTVNTGDGRAQLRFADGAMMSLQPGTEFRIDDYNYNGKNDGQEKGFFSLLRGGLRTISGYIGKGNRDAYRVTTSVATIGIRGTEWSGTLSGTGDDTQLNLGTGEGAIEACNAGGCITVASGESAVVIGSSAPRRTDVRPSLPPQGTVNPPPPLAPYTPTENRNPDGTLPVIENATAQFPTGTNYAVAASGLFNTGEGISQIIDQNAPASVTFVDGKPTAIAGSGYTYTPVSVVEMATLKDEGSPDAVIGWGRWTAGQAVDNVYGSTYNLIDGHFVVGVPTSNAQIAQLSGTYSYDVKGATTPTWANSSGATGTGTLNSANLAVNFNGGAGYNTNLSVNVTADGKTFTANASGGSSTTSNFNGSGWGSVGSNSAYLQYKGLLAGNNAKFAGVTFGFQEYGGSNTVVHGAIGFGKGAVVPPPQ
jgi:hypothetical protein